jgi:hypothetical protein
MTERSQNIPESPEENENPEVYSIHQDGEGKIHFSRKDFLTLSAAVGGTLLIRGVCPRFGTRAAPSEPAQAGMTRLPKVNIHAEPSIASNIMDTLQHNDLVRLISDHPDLGWAEVATQNIQHGWIKRSFIDFSRAVKSSSPNFDLSNSPPQSPTIADPSLSFSTQLRQGENPPSQVSAPGQNLACGEIIQNGDYEAGSVIWVEETTGAIITDQWADPYQGSWVAWFGGDGGIERLTQLFHVPAYVQDAQRFDFYLKVTSNDPYIAINDVFYMRFLDGVGNPVSSNIKIADNTTRMDWTYIYVDVNGMAGFADQDMQVQFVVELTSNSYITNFVVDSVSFDLACNDTPTPTATSTPKPEYYIYLPIIARVAPPTPTSTPTPSATPCPSYDPCPTDCSGDCPFDCGSDCSYDCTYDCSNDCTFECIYDCTFDCIYDCSYDW